MVIAGSWGPVEAVHSCHMETPSLTVGQSSKLFVWRVSYVIVE